MQPWRATCDVLWHGLPKFYSIKFVHSSKAGIQVFMTIIHLCPLATSP